MRKIEENETIEENEEKSSSLAASRRLQKAKGLSSSKRREVADSCRDIPRYVREVSTSTAAVRQLTQT